MAQYKHSKYIVAAADPDSLEIVATGFDNETQAERAAIELAHATPGQTFRVFATCSIWQQTSRVVRIA